MRLMRAGIGTIATDRAWSVLLGAGLCMFCGQPAVVLFTFGVFAPEIAAETGWPPIAVAAAIGPATIAGALLAPAVGRAADVLGVRRVALIGGPAYAVGFVLLGLCQRPGQFAMLLALLCALGFAATPVLYVQLTTRWFARRRGLALSLILSCTSLGVAVWPPVAARLIAGHGWRTAYAAMGMTAGAIILLCALFLLRDPPVPAHGRDDEAEGLSVPQALRGGTFWAIAAVFALLTGVLAGVTVNLPVMLRERGLPPMAAASILSVVGAAMFVGRLSVGAMLDRWFAPFVTAAIAVLPIVALILLIADADRTVLYVAAVLLGLGLGSEMDAAAYLGSRAFGVRCFGAIYGAITLAYGLSSAVGPAAVGAALTGGMSPGTVFLVCLAALVPVPIVLLSFRRRHLPFAVQLRGEVP